MVLRSLMMDDKRLLAVYVTALEDIVVHVDVFEVAGRSNAERKQARKDLADAFTKIPADG